MGIKDSIIKGQVMEMLTQYGLDNKESADTIGFQESNFDSILDALNEKQDIDQTLNSVLGICENPIVMSQLLKPQRKSLCEKFGIDLYNNVFKTPNTLAESLLNGRLGENRY